VLGWVSSSCRCRCRPRRARAVLCPAFRFFGPPCRAPSLWSAAVAEPPACTPLCACEILHTVAQPCTPERTHTYLGGQGRAFGFFFLASGTPPTCLPRRRGLCHAGCRVHARAGEKGEVLRAFREPSPPTRPHTFVRRRRPREPCLLSVAMSADLSTAMAEPPCATGQGVKAPTFRPLWPRLFHMRTRPTSGRPHAPSPMRMPPPRRRPSHAKTPRCVVSPSCADARPKAVLFLALASLGYDRTWLRCGSSHCCRTSPPASYGRAAVPLGQTIEHLRVAAKPSGGFSLTYQPTRRCSCSESIGSCAPGQSGPLAHAFPRRAALQRIQWRSRAPRPVGSHAGHS
jgi:hypothetical protein